MIIARTPFRISFFGGGTDFPAFYKEHGGRALLTTVNKYCYISIHELSPFFKHKWRASYAQTELVQSPEEFQHPLIRECLLMSGIQHGLEISHVSDLPGQTGLGTSSSFTVGLLHALHTFLEEDTSAEALAREAIVVERERVGDTGGHQDQYAAAYGGLLRLDFSGDSDVSVRNLEIPEDRLEALTEHLMMFYTGVECSAEAILQDQQKSIDRNTESLLKMLGLVDDAEQVLSGGGDLDDFGALLHETWQMKKSLAKGITNSEIDKAYEAALAAGARGGKLLGAGGRGFLLLYARPECQQAIREALRALLEVPFSLGAEGSRIIFRTEE